MYFIHSKKKMILPMLFSCLAPLYTQNQSPSSTRVEAQATEGDGIWTE